ncbi:hypothetical protein FJY63_03765 [Candidatus Sumerlaeota bacterium]|nr:hypothetical protein [Candidatus Sumerlaeota bacterium]
MEHEVLLLLARYGERKVLSALAKKLGLSPEEMSGKLRKLAEIHPKVVADNLSRSRPKIDRLLMRYPNKSEYLNILFDRFQHRAFLGEFRQIREFFRWHNGDMGGIKSRTAAVHRLFSLLASLDESQLATLCQDSQKGEQSSLGIISDEILGQRK